MQESVNLFWFASFSERLIGITSLSIANIAIIASAFFILLINFISYKFLRNNDEFVNIQGAD